MFDGGETGCGELLLDLLLFKKAQPDGATVKVRALDPGAPLEIPAWCRLTKHLMLSSKHPSERDPSHHPFRCLRFGEWRPQFRTLRVESSRQFVPVP